jgi:hypothetical protein
MRALKPSVNSILSAIDFCGSLFWEPKVLVVYGGYCLVGSIRFTLYGAYCASYCLLWFLSDLLFTEDTLWFCVCCGWSLVYCLLFAIVSVSFTVHPFLCLLSGLLSAIVTVCDTFNCLLWWLCGLLFTVYGRHILVYCLLSAVGTAQFAICCLRWLLFSPSLDAVTYWSTVQFDLYCSSGVV